MIGVISELVVIVVVEVSILVVVMLGVVAVVVLVGVVLVVVVIVVILLEIVVVNKSVVDVDWVKSKDVLESEIARLVLVAFVVVVTGAPIFIFI